MPNVQSVERALTILNKLSEYPEGIQITRLAEQVGLTKSTLHRLLATLSNLNYVVKDEETDKYKLGLQVLFLSRNLLNDSSIVNVARPYLRKLGQEVNETIHLCIEDNGEVLYIDKIESNQAVQMYSRIGSRAPVYCTGVGKVLLSDMNEERINEILAHTEFIPKTPTTITSKEALLAEIKQVNKQGYALDNAENEAVIRCIAAPIYDHTGHIVASFSISGPSNRVTEEAIQSNLIDKVKQYTKDISKSLGYQGTYK
ncbi:IclR family transcriptional regulator [Priestia endophytica]|jgi:DNA-binding IclR family transcriptional regulator|uniref:Glycerol operon regulatory protein n=2 Tax=Priestia endophytica TaxID=135735 RepID=A0AAX1QHF1_9BACI|nr:IclR family transcriptional regulator [Priestia endophytica]KAB2490057.1 IclR family transcriptional regulator [Priestia endophytica]KYG33779.1 IclR family transcriptional regulator [Priestia endophytica]MBG9812242.1 IclR family transcriptional regulator [Priestia endophytica]MCM3540794.1 IclR family transcriptional regulator [Priestia endophytica]RAS76584.1 IclR family transcriptional regulator [Priestia endophytica]